MIARLGAEFGDRSLEDENEGHRSVSFGVPSGVLTVYSEGVTGMRNSLARKAAAIFVLPGGHR